MDTQDNNHKNPTGKDIREISQEHIESIPGHDSIPDMPATGGKAHDNEDFDNKSDLDRLHENRD